MSENILFWLFKRLVLSQIAPLNGLSGRTDMKTQLDSKEPLEAVPVLTPSGLFREIWAVNGPFENSWMADFNRTVWAAGADGTLGGAEEAKRGSGNA
jgi:hypothetical protein